MAIGQRDLDRSFRIGAALGVVIFLVIVSGARLTLLAWTPSGDFYDAQAASFLDGRLDIEPERLGVEAFSHDGRAYMYQPPWPAILRLPVAAVTDDLEGRLGALSMLLALLVGLAATRRLLAQARRSVLGDDEVASTRFERAAWFSVGLVFAGGSVPLFLAGRPWVYHESAMWGLSWTLAAFAALLQHRRDPTWGSVAAVFLTTAGAVGSRASVGAGACFAAGLVALEALWRPRERPWKARLLGTSGAVALAMAAVVPAAAYAGLNVAKFGSVASIPFDEQTFTDLSPARQRMLDANGGTLFGLQFARATTVRYLRPDGLRLSGQFPFVDAPVPEEPLVDGVLFDLIDRTPSVPASLPALTVAGAVGAIALARRRLDDPLGWSTVVAGGVVSCLTIIPFGYIAHRYLADTMPLLIVLTAVGVSSTARAMVAAAPPDRARWHRWRHAVPWAALIVLVPATIWINIGLATLFQRLYVPEPAPDQVAGLVDARTHLGRAPTVVRADQLPPTAREDDLVVIGDCAAVYIWDGNLTGEFRIDSWEPVERTSAAGHVGVDIDLGELEVGRRYPLVVAPAAGPTVVWIERRRDGELVAGIDRLDAPEGDRTSTGPAIDPAGRSNFDVVLDPFLGVASLDLDGRRIAFNFFPRGSDVSDLQLGSSTGLEGFEPTTPISNARALDDEGDGALCRRLTGE